MYDEFEGAFAQEADLDEDLGDETDEEDLDEDEEEDVAPFEDEEE